MVSRSSVQLFGAIAFASLAFCAFGAELEYVESDSTGVAISGEGLSRVFICEEQAGLPDCLHLDIANVYWSPENPKNDPVELHKDWTALWNQVAAGAAERGANVVVLFNFMGAANEYTQGGSRAHIATLVYVEEPLCPQLEKWPCHPLEIENLRH